MNPTLALAARVQAHLTNEGVPCAIIGAVAMIARGYVRSTQDLDIATSVPLSILERVAERLRADKLGVVLRHPDEHDPLFGVIDIDAGESADPIQIVNFPPSRPLGIATIRGAERLPHLTIPVATLPHLIALKLYAWGGLHLNDAGKDVLALLRANPGIDMDALRGVCAETRVDRLLDEFLERFWNG
ncbi:MAG: hypothetical protein KF878_11115 [Planctomycetes bacterium]|nr:hypothetical protein [Planctomycetota bacterium]